MGSRRIGGSWGPKFYANSLELTLLNSEEVRDEYITMFQLYTSKHYRWSTTTIEQDRVSGCLDIAVRIDNESEYSTVQYTPRL